MESLKPLLPIAAERKNFLPLENIRRLRKQTVDSKKKRDVESDNNDT